MKIEDTLELWHQFVADPRADILDELLADDVRFHSPFVWKPKAGKAAATAILLAAADTFEDFGYIRQLVAGNHLALEFEAHIGDCEYCATYLEQMRQTIRVLGRLPEESLSAAARDTLLAAFRAWPRR